ncbi:phosphoribosyl-AMP cyclohydrolase [bacterium]|nr:phosphoribosyl-AMP cyclohydrolase [bacterium]
MDIETIKFDEKGLVPVITQDDETGDVLMFAWMNLESLKKTLETGVMTYWSRSRQELWVKGERSGNTQVVRKVFVDCDADCLLFRVTSQGHGAACHKGYRSCFYRTIDPKDGSFTIVAQRVFDPDDVYKN